MTKANTDALKGQIQTQQAQTQVAETPQKRLDNILKKMAPEISRALPKHMDAERLARIALSTASSNPKLMEIATGSKEGQTSFLAGLMQLSQLGLEPNTGLGQAYLIPYGNKVQVQISYLGLIDLATRTGQYKSIYAHEVYANDEFSYAYGLNKDLIHVPADDPQGEPIGYYAVYHLQNGGYDFMYMTREKIMKHKSKFSKAANVWQTNFDAMAKKTVLKQVLKYAPKSIEFAKVVNADETVKEEIKEDMSEVIDVTDYSVLEDNEKQQDNK